MEKHSQDLEIIDEQELALRLKLDLKVIRKAIKYGQLRPGRHYFIIGDGKPRFQWSPSLITKIHEDCFQSPAKEAVSRPLMKKGRPTKGSRINKDYFFQ